MGDNRDIRMLEDELERLQQLIASVDSEDSRYEELRGKLNALEEKQEELRKFWRDLDSFRDVFKIPDLSERVEALEDFSGIEDELAKKEFHTLASGSNIQPPYYQRFKEFLSLRKLCSTSKTYFESYRERIDAVYFTRLKPVLPLELHLDDFVVVFSVISQGSSPVSDIMITNGFGDYHDSIVVKKGEVESISISPNQKLAIFSFGFGYYVHSLQPPRGSRGEIPSHNLNPSIPEWSKNSKFIFVPSHGFFDAYLKRDTFLGPFSSYQKTQVRAPISAHRDKRSLFLTFEGIGYPLFEADETCVVGPFDVAFPHTRT